MGQYFFRLPDIGEGVAEAEITAWHVKPGDQVREDQPLLDVMTDKATVDMTSPVDGTVVKLHGEVGAMAPVGSVLVEMDVAGAGEKPAAKKSAEKDINAKDVLENARTGEVKPAPVNSDPTASPATRRRAMEWGIRLEDVAGTGPHGRILTEDLQRHRTAKAGPAPRHGSEKIVLTGLRRRF
ncbi:MAG TPA: biotin/lipoyl-containing protein, partial [Rhizomicrobium sp.]|nr:biotin/lipoyl-containing protein [Rhizomicrobium sp.]